MRLILLIMSFAITIAHGQDRDIGKEYTTRSEVIARNGMAATSQPLATQTAIDILKSGGSAVDAAIAANAVLGLVEPDNCGIGGDLFAIVWDAGTQRIHGLNASGRSPYSLSREYLLEEGYEGIPVRGPLSLSVPGAVDGWFELHDKFGELSMKEILEPAIQYARDGFPVSEVIARWWQSGAESASQYPGYKEVFMPGGKALKKGEIFRNPALANTYELLAEKGREAYYKGEIAAKIATFVKEHGGFLSEKDLNDHKSEWVSPVSVNYRGYDVLELPPNGQGIAALQMLNMLEEFKLELLEFGSPEYIHVFTEIKKLVFEDRAKYYADPEFAKIPIQELLSKDYARERLTQINPDTAAKSFPAGKLKNGDTIYLTVADKDGNMVSLIQSNFWGFGSGLTPPELGFVLQNRGALFTLEEGHSNQFEPHKRPFHTIIPAFVLKNGKPFMSFGVMGGSMQPQGHAQILVNIIDFGMNLQEAGDAPRIRHLGSSQPTGTEMTDGGTLYLESGFDEKVRKKLEKMGHILGEEGGFFGGYQAIMVDPENKVYYGASESRKDGQAAGY